MRFRPREDYILIKPISRVASRIIDCILHEAPNIGTVIAIGTGKRQVNSKGKETGRTFPIAVKVGDVVRYMEWKGLFPEYEENLQRYLIIQEADIAGIEEGYQHAA